MSVTPKHIPIHGLFEAHLTVKDIDRAVAFYRDTLGLELARVFPEPNAAFFWIGGRGKTMLGLWRADAMPFSISRHIALQVNLPDLLKAAPWLRQAGIISRDFDGSPTDEPVVLAWMPAASIYFNDPDDNLVELITMLSDTPKPDLGVVPWSDWLRVTRNTNR